MGEVKNHTGRVKDLGRARSGMVEADMGHARTGADMVQGRVYRKMATERERGKEAERVRQRDLERGIYLGDFDRSVTETATERAQSGGLSWNNVDRAHELLDRPPTGSLGVERMRRREKGAEARREAEREGVRGRARDGVRSGVGEEADVMGGGGDYNEGGDEQYLRMATCDSSVRPGRSRGGGVRGGQGGVGGEWECDTSAGREEEEESEGDSEEDMGLRTKAASWQKQQQQQQQQGYDASAAAHSASASAVSHSSGGPRRIQHSATAGEAGGRERRRGKVLGSAGEKRGGGLGGAGEEEDEGISSDHLTRIAAQMMGFEDGEDGQIGQIGQVGQDGQEMFLQEPRQGELIGPSALLPPSHSSSRPSSIRKAHSASAKPAKSGGSAAGSGTGIVSDSHFVEDLLQLGLNDSRLRDWAARFKAGQTDRRELQTLLLELQEKQRLQGAGEGAGGTGEEWMGGYAVGADDAEGVAESVAAAAAGSGLGLGFMGGSRPRSSSRRLASSSGVRSRPTSSSHHNRTQRAGHARFGSSIGLGTGLGGLVSGAGSGDALEGSGSEGGSDAEDFLTSVPPSALDVLQGSGQAKKKPPTGNRKSPLSGATPGESSTSSGVPSARSGPLISSGSVPSRSRGTSAASILRHGSWEQREFAQLAEQFGLDAEEEGLGGLVEDGRQPGGVGGPGAGLSGVGGRWIGKSSSVPEAGPSGGSWGSPGVVGGVGGVGLGGKGGVEGVGDTEDEVQGGGANGVVESGATAATAGGGGRGGGDLYGGGVQGGGLADLYGSDRMAAAASATAASAGGGGSAAAGVGKTAASAGAAAHTGDLYAAVSPPQSFSPPPNLPPPHPSAPLPPASSLSRKPPQPRLPRAFSADTVNAPSPRSHPGEGEISGVISGAREGEADGVGELRGADEGMLSLERNLSLPSPKPVVQVEEASFDRNLSLHNVIKKRISSHAGEVGQQFARLSTLLKKSSSTPNAPGVGGSGASSGGKRPAQEGKKPPKPAKCGSDRPSSGNPLARTSSIAAEFGDLPAPKRTHYQYSELQPTDLSVLPFPTPRPICHCQLATENFNEANVLGQGGFGKVYYGVLPVHPAQGGEQGDEEFVTELELLSRLEHKHLVKLMGYCMRKDQRLLVYEFLPNGSLADHLHGKKVRQNGPLSWEKRLKIAVGSARGLRYLHSQRPQVLHRDVKSPNILITDSYVAKVADFGCAKLIKQTILVEDPNTGQMVETLGENVDVAMGTHGHMAPEILMTGEISAATDVYRYVRGCLWIEGIAIFRTGGRECSHSHARRSEFS
ncbi:unnamed protein product [Closterium sp. NIES-53]